MDSKQAQIQLDKALRHQTAGRLDEAEAVLDELIAALGERPRLLHYKGVTCAMRGDLETGIDLMRRGLEAAPDDPVQNVDLGVLLTRQGRMDEATGHFRRAAETAPNYELAHANLGAALLAQGEGIEAIRHLRRAVDLDGKLLDAHLNLGRALSQAKAFGQAVDILYKALAIDPLSVAAHILIAHALFRRERHDAAEHHARRALELAPEAAEPRLELAQVLAAQGRMEAAESELLAVAAMPGKGLMALIRLVNLRRTHPDSPEAKALEQALEQPEAFDDNGRANLFFAAAKAFDDMGDPVRAFRHLEQANALAARLHPFDADAYDARAARLRSLAAPALLDRISGRGITHIAPIFITGMPRSGTTLTEQMLSRHDRITAGGEMRAMPEAIFRVPHLRAAIRGEASLDHIDADDLADLGAAYMDAVRAEGIRTERHTDKMPGNYLHAALIAAALPRARIIVLRRHPLDCLLSNHFQNFGSNQAFSSSFEGLARVYRIFDQTWRTMDAALPGRLRVLNYETLTTDPETVLRDLLDWLEMDWQPEVLDFARSSRAVNTASVAQVREPLHGRSVQRWRPYASQLTPLAARLGDLLPEEDRRLFGLEPHTSARV